MSFSSAVKEEACRAPITKKCCAVAESYGVLLFCNSFTYSGIRILTESRAFAQRLPRLFSAAFGISPDSVTGGENGAKFAVSVTERGKISRIFEAIGYGEQRDVALHLNLGVVEEECCAASFLRGAFLSGGSVTDPEKRYHLEFVTSHYYVAREIHAFLFEHGFEPKDAERRSYYVTYFKSSGQIEDILTKLGAPVSSMEVMSAKVQKELINGANRKYNCDVANADKTVEAAQEQIEAIRLLREGGLFDALPARLRETALLREENPELSIAQLAETFSPPVSKSCLNHRLRKLTELAENRE